MTNRALSAAMQARQDQVDRIQAAAGKNVVRGFSQMNVDLDTATVICALLDRIEALEGRGK